MKENWVNLRNSLFPKEFGFIFCMIRSSRITKVFITHSSFIPMTRSPSLNYINGNFLFADFHSYFQLFQWTNHFCCQSSTSLSLSTLTFTFQPKQMHICTELDASAAAGFLLGSDCVKVGDAVLNLRLKRFLKNSDSVQKRFKSKSYQS